MYYLLKYCGVFLFCLNAIAQNSIDEAIQKYNSNSIDYIDVKSLKTELKTGQDLGLLDSRSKAEYNVSHLKNAIWVGYDTFDKEKVNHLDKDAEIVVYCSIGVRSEQIGEQLEAMGFKHIQNLYGGIFEWINHGYPVYKNNKPTQNVHPYDKFWGKFLKRGHKVLE